MHFIPQKQHFSDEDYKKLVGMYITTEAWDRFITAYNILINPDNNETYEQALISIFKRLTISLPFDLIAKIFRETGIIVLRPPLDNNWWDVETDRLCVIILLTQSLFLLIKKSYL
jgi:hypothetical protein